MLSCNAFANAWMDPAVAVGAGSGLRVKAKGGPPVEQLPAVEFLSLAMSSRRVGDQRRWLSRPSHAGLWVEYGWMNHSCVPNAVNYVLGESMVVRVAGPEDSE